MKTDVTYSETDEESDNLYDIFPGKFIVDETTTQNYIKSLVDGHLLQTFSNDIENNDICINVLTYQFVNTIHLSAVKSAKFRTFNRYKRKKTF